MVRGTGGRKLEGWAGRLGASRRDERMEEAGDIRKGSIGKNGRGRRGRGKEDQEDPTDRCMEGSAAGEGQETAHVTVGVVGLRVAWIGLGRMALLRVTEIASELVVMQLCWAKKKSQWGPAEPAKPGSCVPNKIPWRRSQPRQRNWIMTSSS